jgi:hypothetical protein
MGELRIIHIIGPSVEFRTRYILHRGKVTDIYIAVIGDKDKSYISNCDERKPRRNGEDPTHETSR